LVITFALGIFVLAGACIAGFAKDEQRICDLSVAVALGAITVLLVLDLAPEASEGVEVIGWPITILAAAIGFGILVALDRFLPESPSAHHDSHAHSTAFHISIATTIALSVHNIIEGMSVYGVASQSVTTALMLAFGIGIHNMPMGMIVYSGVRRQSNGKRITILGIAVLSTFIGGLIMFAAGSAITEEVVTFMVAVTIGLLLYTVVCELIPHVLHATNRPLAAGGVLAGGLIVFIGISLAGLA
jgi:ZIP family zinc transporter